jgi:hypothetical protein
MLRSPIVRLSVVAAIAAGAIVLSGAGAAAPAAARWGDHGHRIVGEVAAQALPAEMPAFFRAATAQLSYLNPEPDRWRDRRERDLDPAMDGLHAYDHYIDMERVPGNALQALNRYDFVDSIRRAGHSVPDVGVLPYAALELVQRIRVGFREWRAATDPQVRGFIEQRIINDAGLLGHYVADGANPHHTTIHHDRWISDINPRGYTTERGFHSRFESQFVGARLSVGDVRPLVVAPARTVMPVRDGINAYLMQSFALVERLYQLDLEERFSATTQSAGHKQFAAERLAAGATMLRDLWWTAWVTSVPQPGQQ